MKREWQTSGLGLVRMLFGVVLAIDASFKWSPAFFSNFVGYLSSAAQGQPLHVHAWISMWINIVRLNPSFFAYTIAACETLVAFGLLVGIFGAFVDVFGAMLMLLIWSTAEGFGGPYKPESTDIGTAIIYVLVFGALFFSHASEYLGLDGLRHRRAALSAHTSVY